MPDVPSELYHEIFQEAPIGLAISDERGHVVVVNESLLKLGGYARADIKESWAVDFYYDGDDERKRVMAEAAKQGGRITRHELRFRKKDGSPFWAYMSLQPFMLDGRRYVIAMIEDITELKSAREERDRQEAENREIMRTLVGREQKMIELKERIAKLEEKRD